MIDTPGSGNARAGYFIAASFLLVFGFGVGIAMNLIIHATAPAQGIKVFFMTVYPTFGLYSIIVFVLGALSTIVALGMIWLGIDKPVGPLTLQDPEGRPGDTIPIGTDSH